MAEILRMDDGYGGFIGDQSRMPGKPGSHVAYARGSDLVIDWYDFGGDVPYESGNLLIFDRAAQALLAAALEAEVSLSPHELSNWVATRLASYFAVKKFATERGIPFETEVDFWP